PGWSPGLTIGAGTKPTRTCVMPCVPARPSAICTTTTRYSTFGWPGNWAAIAGFSSTAMTLPTTATSAAATRRAAGCGAGMATRATLRASSSPRRAGAAVRARTDRQRRCLVTGVFLKGCDGPGRRMGSLLRGDDALDAVGVGVLLEPLPGRGLELIGGLRRHPAVLGGQAELVEQQVRHERVRALLVPVGVGQRQQDEAAQLGVGRLEGAG